MRLRFAGGVLAAEPGLISRIYDSHFRIEMENYDVGQRWVPRHEPGVLRNFPQLLS